MLHLPGLINDLAIILVVATIVTFIFKAINQPIVLGYIIAGFLVSPNVDLVPTIADGETIKIWAEIGVIFLLFGLGLEFSFKKLKDVGGPASITGVVEVLCMLSAGYATGKLLGWSEMDSIFLGGILSISSTTIIIRAFDELGIKTQHFATVVFGVLIVEDLVAILLLVLLSTIAVTQQFQGFQLITSSLKLIFFLSLWFISGIFLIPSILRKFKKHLNDEMLLIFSLGLCLLMVVLATQVGFSPALGAFVMGSILAETTEGKRIEHLIQPMKNFFGAIFFVSVGMLINPAILIEHWPSAIIITFVTIVGKFLSSAAGSLISGQTIKNSVQTGLSLSQIGEFSFIIATLGLTLKVTSDFLYPLAVAVSVITTFTTPYLIKYSERFAGALEAILPSKVKIFSQRYSSSTQAIAVSGQAKEVVKNYLIQVVLLCIVIISITIICRELLLPFLIETISSKKVASSLAFIITFITTAPFYWAIVSKKITSQFETISSPKLAILPYVLLFFRFAVVASILGFQISVFLPTILSLAVIIAISSFGLLKFSTNLGDVYQWIEKTFIRNLNANTAPPSPYSTLLPWEAHLASYEVPQNAPYLGKTLESLAVRERFGVSVVLIERGHKKIKAPSRFEAVYPFDKISVIGTDEQLDNFRVFLNSFPVDEDEFRVEDYGLKGCILSEGSQFLGKTIRTSGIRELTEGLIVGLERGSERKINPDSNIMLQVNDVLWIVGNKEKLKNLF